VSDHDYFRQPVTLSGESPATVEAVDTSGTPKYEESPQTSKSLESSETPRTARTPSPHHEKGRPFSYPHHEILFKCVAKGELIVSSSEVMKSVKTKVDAFLHHRWISVLEVDTIHVLCLSVENNKSVQRSLEFNAKGGVNLFVHREPLPIDDFLCDVTPFIPLEDDTVNDFVDRIITIVNNVRKMEVCSGMMN